MRHGDHLPRLSVARAKAGMVEAQRGETRVCEAACESSRRASRLPPRRDAITDTEYGAKHPSLPMQIPPRNAEHLAFSDHLCRFNSLDHRPSRCCRPRSLHRAQPPLDVPVMPTCRSRVRQGPRRATRKAATRTGTPRAAADAMIDSRNQTGCIKNAPRNHWTSLGVSSHTSQGKTT